MYKPVTQIGERIRQRYSRGFDQKNSMGLNQSPLWTPIKMHENILCKNWKHLLVSASNIGSTDFLALTMSYSRNSLC